MNSDIQKAIEVLSDGGIVIFPTDTAFGIGCRVDREDSIKRLFQIRKRPETQAMSVLVSSVEMAKEYVQNIPQEVQEKLINKYWPGALTVVLNAQESVLKSVTGGGFTVGVRIPNHLATLELINGLGVGLLGPSANFHGEQTPYSMDDLSPELVRLVDYVVPGECIVKEASTVIDCTVAPWKIIRDGAVKL